MSVVLVVTFVLLLILHVPVVYCMLLSSVAALLYEGGTSLHMVGSEMSRAMFGFYPFLAVPFFILAGDLMNRGGLSRKITDLANSVVGPLPGGLAMVTTFSAQMFGAISGASSATCVAVGKIMIPAMEEQKYPREFATALAACSGITGALIPPSIVLLIYATVSPVPVSVERLFMGGVIPGILLGVGLMIVSFFYARKQGIKTLPWVGPGNMLKAALGAVLPLMLVVIIFGGILGGIFNATEASAVAVFYALFVSVCLFRQLKIGGLPGVFIDAGKTTAALAFLISAAALFAKVLAIGYLPQQIAQGLLSGCEKAVALIGGGELVNKILVLLVLNVILLLIGMFVDEGPALLIVVPVLAPVGQVIGVDPTHFGVMVVFNLTLGLVTPPVGTTLFVASGIGEVTISRMIPHVLRYLPVMIVVLLLITYVPWLSTWLPGFIK